MLGKNKDLSISKDLWTLEQYEQGVKTTTENSIEQGKSIIEEDEKLCENIKKESEKLNEITEKDKNSKNEDEEHDKIINREGEDRDEPDAKKMRQGNGKSD